MKSRCIVFLLMIFLASSYLSSVIGEVFIRSGKAMEQEDQLIGMANPAAVYCIELGYDYQIVNEKSGQRGICIFPDGSSCDAWDFLEGKCGKNYSYCALCGYETKTLTDGKNPFSHEYAICISKEGKCIGSVTELMSLSEKINVGTLQSGSSANEEADTPSTSEAQVPTSFDWRNHNGHDWMTPVKNQGTCGSCWAFAAVGVVEALENIRNNDSDLDLDLSEQYLVSDCLTHGTCCGGSHGIALRFIYGKGIPDEECLPYIDGSGCTCSDGCDDNCEHNSDGKCSHVTCSDRCPDWQSRLVKADSTGYIAQRLLATPAEMKEYITGTAPLPASIMMGYQYGYWDGDIYRCRDDSSAHGGNHVVVIAGYDDPGGYWIIKNSYGTGMGENGYFKLGYGECGIENQTFYCHTNELDCGCILTRNTVLDQDLLDCSHGLGIGADNITLDCNSHHIHGLKPDRYFGSTRGIEIYYCDNVTIKNCFVSGFNEGIMMWGCSYNNLTGNAINDNTEGIKLLYGSHNTLFGNIVSNSILGIYLFGISEDNWLEGNTVNSNVYGIYACNYLSSSTLNFNILDNNSSYGIKLKNCSDNRLVDNISRNNGSNGLQLMGFSCNNEITGNQFLKNPRYGVVLYDSCRYNTFSRNAFADNGSYNAYEYYNATNNEWSFAGIGNQWSDFKTNPGYPDSYVVHGSGDGVDYYPRQYVDVIEDHHEEESAIPRGASLTQNYPNPFNPWTTIEYTVPERSWVTVTIYDILGRRIRTLLDQYQLAGYRTVVWDGKSDSGKEVAGGIYFYRLQAGDFVDAKKMLLLK